MATIRGKKVDWLSGGGDLRVRALLNDEDDEAKKQNAGREAPVMLEDAVASSGAPFGRVIVVDAGSVIKFEVRSNGPVGFGYRVETPAEPIAERLYCLKEREEASDPITDVLRRYQSANALIRIDDWRSLGLDTPESRAARWNVRFTSWKVHGYLDHVKAMYFGTPRPVVKELPATGTAGLSAGVSGGGAGVLGGSVTAWTKRTSAQELGTISGVNEDEHNNGYLDVTLFTLSDPSERSQLFL